MDWWAVGMYLAAFFVSITSASKKMYSACPATRSTLAPGRHFRDEVAARLFAQQAADKFRIAYVVWEIIDGPKAFRTLGIYPPRSEGRLS
jgi:hypothetical protein